VRSGGKKWNAGDLFSKEAGEWMNEDEKSSFLKGGHRGRLCTVSFQVPVE